MMPGERTIQSPVGGWNARDALAAMAATDAVDLVNLVPGNGVVTGRGGSHTVLTGLSGSVQTLFPYDGSGSQKILAAYSGNISNITGFTTPTVLGSGFSSNFWQWASFDSTMVMCNGINNSQVYNGTALTALVATQLATPVNAAFSTSTTGGTLAAATYYVRVSAINAIGETLASTETSQVTTGSTSTATYNWGAVTGATGYRIYRSTTSGAELRLVQVGTVTTYTDTGAVTPSGALPGSNTTAPDVTSFVGVVNFKGRAFYWQLSSPNAWYTDAGAFQGTFHKLPLGTVAQRGGYIVQIITWTRDSGDGVDDYCAFIFNTGETLIYQGDDPSQSLRWSMVGRYSLGAPLGVRAHTRYASTEIILTADGFVGLDEAIQNARSEVINTFGGKIERAASTAAQQYPASRRWSCIYYPRGNLFLVNVPISTTEAEQYVKNTNTGSWCRFQGWPAQSFCLFGDRLYFGTSDGRVVLADTSAADPYRQAYSDDGQSISYSCQSAYQKFGSPGLKTQMTAARVVTNVFDVRAIGINCFADYRVKPVYAIPDPVEFSQGQWNVSPWNADSWASEELDPTSMYARESFRPVQGFGYALSLNIRYRSKVQQISWFSTTFVYKQAGVN